MAKGDDSRSKYLLSKEALPKIDIPTKSVHEQRQFALPAALRGDGAAAEPAEVPAAQPAEPTEPPAPKGQKKPAKSEPAPEVAAPPAKRGEKLERPSQEKAPARPRVIRVEPPAKLGESEGDAALDDDESADEPRSRGFLFYLIGAAVVLLAVGLGYWLTTRGTADDGTAAKPAPRPTSEPRSSEATGAPDTSAHGTAAPSPATAPASVPEAPSSDTNAAAPAATFSATVHTDPATATVELVGTDELGNSPMTFEGLDKGTSHTVLVSKAGYVSKEVTLDPAAEGPLRVTLEAKPKILRIETVPDGAIVYIERRRVRDKVTPMETPVPKWLLRRKRIKVGIRKAGYAKLDAWVPADDGWLEETDAVVYNLEGKLELAPKAPHRRARRKTAQSEEGGSAEQPSTGADTGGEEPTTEEVEPGTGAGADDGAEAAGDEAGNDDQAPGTDEQAAGDDAPEGKPPAPKEPPPTPTPDWQ